MSPFRIAILLSGQSRTWKTSADNILNYFNIKINQFTNQKVEVDFFIHTWDTNSYRDKTQEREEGINYLLEDSVQNEIQNKFNPIYMEYEKYDANNFVNAWSPLFYSFMKCTHLKRKYEIENDFVYGLVIKSRFDLNFSLDNVNRFGIMTNKFHIHPVEHMHLLNTYLDLQENLILLGLMMYFFIQIHLLWISYQMHIDGNTKL